MPYPSNTMYFMYLSSNPKTARVTENRIFITPRNWLKSCNQVASKQVSFRDGDEAWKHRLCIKLCTPYWHILHRVHVLQPAALVRCHWVSIFIDSQRNQRSQWAKLVQPKIEKVELLHYKWILTFWAPRKDAFQIYCP